MRTALLLLLLLTMPVTAQAALSRHQLDGVALAPPPDAALPLDLRFRDATGRQLSLRDAIGSGPALVLFVDYSCRTVCKPALAITAGALAQTSLKPNQDYRLIVAGLDPKDSPASAGDMLQQIGDPRISKATTALMSDGDNVKRLADAAGYSFRYDPDIDQFAHPAGLLVLTHSGHIARALSSLALNPQDLKLALIDAGQGSVGGLAGRLTLLCYGFDAAHGVYAPTIVKLLQIGGATTVLLLVGAIALMARRGALARGARP
jgi:protein SCO1/2